MTVISAIDPWLYVQFYGSNFTQLIASGNGYLSFNTALANTFSHWSQTPGNVLNTGYDGAWPWACSMISTRV